MPANNVLFGFFGGIIAFALMHYAKLFGYDVPTDISTALPAAVSVAMAHGWDVWTGENKKPKA